uniref:Putative secreted protein n=1 Tax=Anopheles darlingi TaxID=43151 RepID=A0A2M4DI81_ANODA
MSILRFVLLVTTAPEYVHSILRPVHDATPLHRHHLHDRHHYLHRLQAGITSWYEPPERERESFSFPYHYRLN